MKRAPRPNTAAVVDATAEAVAVSAVASEADAAAVAGDAAAIKFRFLGERLFFATAGSVLLSRTRLAAHESERTFPDQNYNILSPQ